MVDSRTCTRHGSSAEVRGAISDMLARVGDKWSILIVSTLGDGPLRFNELRRQVEDISQKMLSSTLKVLERDGLVAGRSAGRTRVYRLDPRYFAHDDLARLLLRLSEPQRELQGRIAALRRRPRRTGKPV